MPKTNIELQNTQQSAYYMTFHPACEWLETKVTENEQIRK